MVARGGLASGDCVGVSGWTVSGDGGSDNTGWDGINDFDWNSADGWDLNAHGNDGPSQNTATKTIETTNSITGFEGGELFHIGGRATLEHNDGQANAEIKFSIIPTGAGSETIVCEADTPSGEHTLLIWEHIFNYQKEQQVLKLKLQ